MTPRSRRRRWYRAPMQWTGDEAYLEYDQQWIVGGPDSGGVRVFVLRDEHLFYVERDFGGSTISSGISIQDFIARYRGSSDSAYLRIVEDLEQRQRST